MNNVYVAAAAVIDLSEVFFVPIFAVCFGALQNLTIVAWMYPRVTNYKPFYGQL